MKRRKPSAKAKAATEGIPLWDYIKFHAPERLVRVQLDRGELRYTWIDAGNNTRASDDGGPQPPQGWWPRSDDLTRIDETSSVQSHAMFDAMFGPVFPKMNFVRVYPAGTAANPPPEPKTSRRKRAAKKYGVVLEILADIDQSEGLASDLQPADIQQKVLPKVPRKFRRRWEKRGADGRLKQSVSRKVINEAYQEFLRRRDDHGGDDRRGGGAALARSARSSK
jgi:hypothetical protein